MRMRAWRSVVGRAAIAAIGAIAIRALPAQQEVPADKARLADAVRADLSRLTELERGYFAANKRFTIDIKALHFAAKSGAVIAVSYASARTFSASASDARLAPFLCFVIVSSVDAASTAEKPFCTDSRYGTAATALARAGSEPDVPPARSDAAKSPTESVIPVTVSATDHAAVRPTEHVAQPITLTPPEFAERLRIAAGGRDDSLIVIVQFAVKDARYDPSRGVLEVAVERVPLPIAKSQTADADGARPAIACFTRPAFVCGASGLSYIARDVFHVPPSRAPDSESMRSGLTLDARFAIGRRDGTAGPALTLLALVLHSKDAALASWEAPAGH
jgi:hypothetical protein